MNIFTSKQGTRYLVDIDDLITMCNLVEGDISTKSLETTLTGFKIALDEAEAKNV